MESLVERQARVNAACSSLIEIGFNSDLFTVKNIYNYGYIEDEFLEFIKPITSITDLEELRHLYDRMHQISTPNDFSFRQFMYNMNWLQNDVQGRKVMEDVTRRIKKKKLETRELSKSEVSLARNLVDYAASRMQECKRIEGDELKKRQKEVETSAELKAKLGPISEYEEPSVNELRNEAYKLYEEDCRSKGITALPKFHELGIANAMDAYGGVVKEGHFVKYLNDPIRKKWIVNFFNQILTLDYPGGVMVVLGEPLNETGKTVSKLASDVSEEFCGGDGGAVDDRNFVAAESEEARNETTIPFLKLWCAQKIAALCGTRFENRLVEEEEQQKLLHDL